MRTHSLSIVAALLILCLNTAFSAAQSVTFAGTQTTVGSGLSYPWGLGVDRAGNVYVANSGNGTITEIPADGGPQTQVGNGGNPIGLAVDAAGDVFFADPSSNQVVEIPAGGGAQITLGSGLNFPLGVAVDTAGNVFVADTNNQRVVEIPAGGGAQTTVASGLSSPQDVAVDRSGNVFIADPGANRVLEVPAGGGPQTAVGSGLIQPTAVAVDAAGNVFIGNGDNQVLKVPAGGGAQSAVASGLEDPLGVAVDGSGDVFIADDGRSRVLELQLVAVNFGTANICPGVQTTPAPCSQTFTLNYNVVAATTFGTINVLTQGAPNLDFTMSSTTCTGTQTSGSSCTVVVSFAPRAPGLRMGAVQLTDNLGNVLATTLIHGQGQGPAMAFGPGTQTTMGSSLSVPSGVAVDGAGDVFIADTLNNRVVEVPAGGGAQTTLGSGLTNPYGVAVDGAGDVFIADTLNNRVVEVPAGGGVQTTVSSGLSSPYDVAVDGAGNVFIADTGNDRVVEVPAVGGAQTAVGSGLSSPYAVAVDGAGDVFIADHNNHRVVEVSALGGAQTTVVSGLSNPFGVAVDGAGDVFISDFGTQQVVEVPAGGSAQTTVISGLNFPYAVAVDAVGDILIADAGNNRVLQVQRAQPPAFSFASTAVSNTSTDSPQSVTVQNIGNQLLAAVAPGLSIGANFAQVAGPGSPADCSSSFSLSPGATCNLSVSFTPQAVGSIASAATFTDNALNGVTASQNVTLRGIATQESQTITFAAPSNQPIGTPPFLLSASASSALAVSFASATPVVCIVSGATVTLVAVGTCSIQATQAGNTNFAAATPVTQNFQVTQDSQTVSFGALLNQALGTAPFTLSATASSGLAVSFAATTPAVCTVSGATMTLVAAGTCTIQAMQTGNTNYGAATPVNQSYQISDFTLTSSSTTMTVTAGQPAMFTLTVTPQGSFASAIKLACKGLPAMAGCAFSSATLTPNASTVTATLNITTAAPTTALVLPPSDHRSSPLYAIWLLLPAMFLSALGIAPKGRKLLSYFFVFLLVGGCLLQVACGGASHGVNTTTGTPAGTYSVIVSGAAGSNQHTTTIKLTIQ
jgi:large repetitive protein